HLDVAVLAARVDIGGLRANVEIRTLRARDAQTNLGATIERDPEAVTEAHLDDDLVPFTAPEHLDPSVLDQLADGLTSGQSLELDVSLVRCSGLDLDPARRDLEVEAKGTGSGVGLAAHHACGLK